jgi:hypothetical protein
MMSPEGWYQWANLTAAASIMITLLAIGGVILMGVVVKLLSDIRHELRQNNYLLDLARQLASDPSLSRQRMPVE